MRAWMPARPGATADEPVLEHLVGRGLHLRGAAASRTRLGHPRAVEARQRAGLRRRLPGGYLPAAGRRHHAGAELDAYCTDTLRLPGHTHRADLHLLLIIT